MNAEQITAITGAVDYSTIITGIGTIGAAVAIVLVSIKGVKMLLSVVRGG